LRFFRRRGRDPEEKKSSPHDSPAPLPSVPPGLRLAENLGALWQAIDGIAREDGLTGRSAVEHYNLTSEGKKDVERWLQIYLRRVRPGHVYRLPDHYQRHRGFCLIPRVWPDGLRWQAVSEDTLFSAKIPQEPDRSKLIESLDRYLDGN
jgi:hypothetical protein